MFRSKIKDWIARGAFQIYRWASSPEVTATTIPSPPPHGFDDLIGDGFIPCDNSERDVADIFALGDPELEDPHMFEDQPNKFTADRSAVNIPDEDRPLEGSLRARLMGL